MWEEVAGIEESINICMSPKPLLEVARAEGINERMNMMKGQT